MLRPFDVSSAAPRAVNLRHRAIRPAAWRRWVIALSIFAAASQTNAAATITVGSHTLLANTPNQSFTILITGNEQVAGENFFAQIGDGGTANGGTLTKPVFQTVDIVNTTIFAGNNTGATGDQSPGGNAAHPLIWVDGTTANTNVSDTGILATVTINTSGVFSGTFPLILNGVGSHYAAGPFATVLDNTSAKPIALAINNGSITVAPEPATLALSALCGLLALQRRPRRHANA